MILKRISMKFLRRKWSVLATELGVVVVGIFLGLQADDWNEARKFEADESVYLGKIRDDLAQMRGQLVDLTALAETGTARMRAALRAMEACDRSEQAHADLKYALERYQILPPIDYLDATYGEMVASGAHARIRSQDLKRQLAQTFSALREHNLNLRNFRISLPTVDTIVWNHVDYGIDEATGRPVVKFDMAEVCRIRPLRNAVVEMIDIQQDGAGTGRRVIGSVDQALALLDK